MIPRLFLAGAFYSLFLDVCSCAVSKKRNKYYPYGQCSIVKVHTFTIV